MGDGIRDGLTICTTVVIPALFPFMVFSGFVSVTKLCPILAKPFAPITKWLFRLPKEMGTVILLSFIGGYPVGARAMASLIDQGKLSGKTASRMLCFCVNAGPSFLISSVGMALYGYNRIGLTLLVAQVLSSFIIGFVLSRRAEREMASFKPSYMEPTQAFVSSVSSAAMGMFQICAFVVFFSGILSLLRLTGAMDAIARMLAQVLPFDQSVAFYSVLITGLLEVTSGCIAAATLGGKTAFLLSAFFISFGSFSIICQVASCFKAGQVELRPFLLSRLANGFLTAAIAYPLYDKFCADLTVSISSTPPIMVVDTRSVMVALCMIAMCSIVLLSFSVGDVSCRKR